MRLAYTLTKNLTPKLRTKDKWVVLDRDGVINYDTKHYIKTPSEWIPIPGALPSIAKSNKTGHKIIVISNQSVVGRGLITMDAFNQIHNYMIDQIQSYGGEIEKAYYCFHGPDEKCLCRKPNVGLLENAASEFSIQSFVDVPVVGDKQSDIELALNVNAIPIYIKNPMYSINKSIKDQIQKSYITLEDFAHDWTS